MSNLESSVEMNLMISHICTDEKGTKYACVSFTERDKVAEGRIPDCIITNNKGFSSDEINGLQQYLVANLAELKKLASKQNVFNAFMK